VKGFTLWRSEGSGQCCVTLPQDHHFLHSTFFAITLDHDTYPSDRTLIIDFRSTLNSMRPLARICADGNAGKIGNTPKMKRGKRTAPVSPHYISVTCRLYRLAPAENRAIGLRRYPHFASGSNKRSDIGFAHDGVRSLKGFPAVVLRALARLPTANCPLPTAR